jgi:hypothetical protein
VVKGCEDQHRTEARAFRARVSTGHLIREPSSCGGSPHIREVDGAVCRQ